VELPVVIKQLEALAVRATAYRKEREEEKGSILGEKAGGYR